MLMVVPVKRCQVEWNGIENPMPYAASAIHIGEGTDLPDSSTYGALLSFQMRQFGQTAPTICIRGFETITSLPATP